MITSQAQSLVDALKAIGLKHGSWRHDGQFTVRTDTKSIRSRGFRYSEYGDAMASIDKSGQGVALDNVDRLVAEFGMHVTVVGNAAGWRHVIVSTRYNRDATIAYCIDGVWTYRKASHDPRA